MKKQEPTIKGMITIKDVKAIEKTFPGIMAFYRTMKEKPTTFLELEWKFETNNK